LVLPKRSSHLKVATAFIERALEEEQGSVTRAARKLGITHQGLAYILSQRQEHLFGRRTPPKKRKRSIFK
jgi:hypothetical protein